MCDTTAQIQLWPNKPTYRLSLPKINKCRFATEYRKLLVFAHSLWQAESPG